jgi:hypothetical protein
LDYEEDLSALQGLREEGMSYEMLGQTDEAQVSDQEQNLTQEQALEDLQTYGVTRGLDEKMRASIAETLKQNLVNYREQSIAEQQRRRAVAKGVMRRAQTASAQGQAQAPMAPQGQGQNQPQAPNTLPTPKG